MLPKSNRLTKSAFKLVMDKGIAHHSPIAVLKILKTHGKHGFSVSVSKKVSKSAVGRNKIRRRIYSIIKDYRDKIQDGISVLILMKVGSEKLSFDEITKQIESIFVKSGILK